MPDTPRTAAHTLDPVEKATAMSTADHPDAGTPSVLVFDVNETLLDIAHLEPLFERTFGTAGAMREWFAQLILYSEAITLAGAYAPFGELGAAALRMQAEIHGVSISDADVAELGERTGALPAHPEAEDALRRLADAGFRLVTLTNSAPPPDGRTALVRAGLADLFERSFSVDAVRRFKPAPETYRSVTEALDVPLEDTCLVAAHAWDTLGAQALGARGALVTRPGNAVLPLDALSRPDIVGADLGLVADEILRRWRP